MTIANTLSGLGQLFRALSIVRAPLLTALVGAAALAGPQQSRETLRLLALDFAVHQTQVWSAFSLLALVSFAIWRMARDLAIASRQQDEPLTLATLAWLPTIAGVVVPLGATLGLLWSSQELGIGNVPKQALDLVFDGTAIADELAGGQRRLLLGACIAAAIAVGVALAGWGFARRRAPGPSSIGDWDVLGRKMRWAMLLLLAVHVGCYTAFPVKVPQVIGLTSILLQFILFVAFCASLITLLADRYRIPAITVLAGWAALISVFDLNDDHTVTPFKADTDARVPVLSGFKNWYDTRSDREDYAAKGEPYPVVVVTAAGGGLYAAQHAATVLARLQDRCPNFAQHVFAMSGVSGGGLGAGLFASLAKLEAPNGRRQPCRLGAQQAPGVFERTLDDILSYDLLSPVAATGLFPDFLQQFLPLPVPAFDRARAFETALADAWSRTRPGTANPLEKGFLDLWSAAKSDHAVPALLLNTTSVSEGYRVTLSPFTGAGFFNVEERLTGIDDFHDYIRSPKGFSDVSLGTAMGLSSRFSWIMPAASIETVRPRTSAPQEESPAWQKWFERRRYNRLVDGGYYENSGTEAMLDILWNLMPELDPSRAALLREGNGRRGTQPATTTASKFKLYLIVITSFQDPKERIDGASEVLSPVRAMLATRQRRGFRAITEAMQEMFSIGDRLWSAFVLNRDDFPLPLGWQMSSVSRQLIARHSGDPHAVKLLDWGELEILGGIADRQNAAHRIGAFVNIGDNSACEIVAALHDDPTAVPKCNGPGQTK